MRTTEAMATRMAMATVEIQMLVAYESLSVNVAVGKSSSRLIATGLLVSSVSIKRYITCMGTYHGVPSRKEMQLPGGRSST